MKIWACVAYGCHLRSDTTGHTVDHHLSPFMVRAGNYYEAVGIADAVMKKTRARHPEYTFWASRVSELPDEFITDPETVTIWDAAK